jgi:hypothetical protein
MNLPKALKLEHILAAVEGSQTGLDNPGFCLACGAEADGCEPEARAYPCDSCGQRKVYGAEEILFMVVP